VLFIHISNFHFLAETNFVFGIPEGTSLFETTSFDILIVKIGAEGLSVWRRQNPNTGRVTLYAPEHVGRGGVDVRSKNPL